MFEVTFYPKRVNHTAEDVNIIIDTVTGSQSNERCAEEGTNTAGDKCS